MARPAGFEPTTPWFVAKYSIQLSYGRLDRQIAGNLNIRIKTVEVHRANIMDKFEVLTMADLMRRFLGSSPD